VTRPQLVVGLDAGTTKVCAVAAEAGKKGTRILGMGIVPSAGMKKGMVINMDAAVDSIRKAVKEAEASSGIRIRSAAITISGAHVKDFGSCGTVGVRGKEVTGTDREAAVDSAKTVYIPLDREVLHVIPTEFLLDGQDGITDPTGMCGVKLEAKVHMVTCAVSPMQNLVRCCERAGLDVANVVFSPIASARSVLTGDEKECGTVLIDIGGGTTDMVLIRGGTVRRAVSLGIGGSHVTGDIAVGLRVSPQEAERLKKTAGSALMEIVGDAQEITLEQPGAECRTLPGRYLAGIIQPRCEEILELIREELGGTSGREAVGCGVVLTGGSSLLKGFDRLAGSILGLPVRTGAPLGVGSSDPAAKTPLVAAALGLVTDETRPPADDPAEANLLGGVLEKMKAWAKDAFGYTGNLKFHNRKEGSALCLKSKK
jgi:cell division protein FtsA